MKKLEKKLYQLIDFLRHMNRRTKDCEFEVRITKGPSAIVDFRERKNPR